MSWGLGINARLCDVTWHVSDDGGQEKEEAIKSVGPNGNEIMKYRFTLLDTSVVFRSAPLSSFPSRGISVHVVGHLLSVTWNSTNSRVFQIDGWGPVRSRDFSVWSVRQLCRQRFFRFKLPPLTFRLPLVCTLPPPQAGQTGGPARKNPGTARHGPSWSGPGRVWSAGQAGLHIFHLILFLSVLKRIRTQISTKNSGDLLRIHNTFICFILSMGQDHFKRGSFIKCDLFLGNWQLLHLALLYVFFFFL